MQTSSLTLALAFVTATLIGCGGPPVPSPLADEEICPDYESASHVRMTGGVRVPVTLTVLDGKKPVFTTTLRGLRSADAPKTMAALPDADAEYSVEWAQCEAKQPERPAKDGPDAGYKCGAAKVYKTDKLVTKKGDAASRTIRFVLPPDATCHIGIVPDGPPPTGSAAPGK